MRLPPLNALRAFEAAARHGGYIPASEELCVTRGAVSRHVKLLEAHLGVQLFRRHARGVDLTDAGRRFQPVLAEAFARIEREAALLCADAADLRVICPPATSIRWLIPRIEGFRTRHPEIEVRLTTDFHGGGGFDRLSYDVGFSVENWPRDTREIEVMPVFPVRLSPACTPALARHLQDPADLGSQTLLHETARRSDWSAWLAAFPDAGFDAGLDTRKTGQDFPNHDTAVRAAVMGAGVVMSDLVLCRDELASGALVLPFPELVCPSPLGAICLLGARDRWDAPKVRAFRDWVAETASADAAAADVVGSGRHSA